MKPILLLLLTFALTPGMAAVRKSAPDALTNRAIKIQYARYQRAMQRQDVPEIMAMLTPDFTWHFPDGKVLNCQQTRQEMKTYFHSIKRIDAMTVLVKEVTVKGNCAITLVTEKVTALMQEPTKEKRITTTETYREFWTKTGQGWKIQQTRLLKP